MLIITETAPRMTNEKEEEMTTAASSLDTKDDSAAKDNENDEPMKDSSGNEESQEQQEETEETKQETKDGEEEPKKPKISAKDWPLRDIKEPSENDVLFGRGGGTNHAQGNKRYRKMVEDRKLEYVNSKRLDKPLVALEIIRLWRAQDPPGRFLKMDNNGLWNDVGDKKAREKTSQALREKAPLIRKQQEEEEKTGTSQDDDDDEKSDGGGEQQQKDSTTTKNTRFAEGTTKESKGGVKKAVLARDHSLGREYLQAGETMNLEGFSWRDPIDQSQGSRTGSQGPPPPGGFPVQRKSSGGMPPPEYRVPSIGPPPPPHMAGPPPPGGYFTRTPTDEYQRTYAQQPPMMPGYNGYGPHQRSGSWTHGPHGMPPLREHSLAQNPLRNASAGHPAPVNAFEAGRSGSGYWGDPSRPPPPGQQPYPGHYREGSGPYYNPPPPPGTRPYGPTAMMPPPVGVPPPYAVDPMIARTWSGQSGDQEGPVNAFEQDFGPREEKQRHSPRSDHARAEQSRQDRSEPPRPNIVKRMTSNQNETIETKPDLIGPSVKRAALNRDSSAAANRLKAASLPEYYNKDGKFDPENAVNALSDNFEQSTLNNGEPPKQQLLSQEDRKSSLDSMAMDLMVKPPAITANSRSSTIEALALDDLDTDPVLGDSGSMPRPSALSANNRMSTMDGIFADLDRVTAKPMTLTASDRISTRDYLDLGDEPLTEIDIERMYDEKAN